MKQYLAANLRNIALAGHGGNGKTSLAEAMLFKAGATDRLGKVENGSTVCDFDAEEIRRVCSVSSAVAPLEWKKSKITLLDTPGLFDFATGLSEGVRAAENVLVVVSARDGLDVGAQKAVALAKKLGRGCAFYVSKTQSEHANYFKVLAGLQQEYGTAICPLVMPIIRDETLVGYANIVERKAFAYDAKGVAKELPFPEDASHLDTYIAALNEAVAESDEELMEKFFMEEPFTHDEICGGIRKGMQGGTLMPVFCGDSLALAATDLLLDGITSYFPTAAEAAGEKATDASGAEVFVECDEKAPLAATVFKTVADPFVGKLSFVKVIAGTLTGDLIPTNARTGETERLGKLVYVTGKKQEDTASVLAGDICAITKLSTAMTGDSLCDARRVVSFAGVPFPKATLTMAIVTKNKGDEGKISQSLNRLIEEDPVISFENNAETKQQILGGLGDQHLDSVVAKLKAKFGVDVGLVAPRVPYREAIRKKVKVQGRHKKQSGGHGQFGDVWIEFEPWDGDGLLFEENVFGGSVPRNFFPAVEKGLIDCIKHGTVAGYPVVGLKATLVDGSYHPVDSSEMAFKLAATLAYKAALPLASPVLLEPIGNLKVHVPDSYTGDVMGDLNKRRGRILGMGPGPDGLQEIEADVPMSEMADFTTTLRSMTQGRGSFELAFSRYETLPSNLEAAVIEDAKQMNTEE